MVGNEGLVGIAVLMGGESTTSWALVHSAGHAYSLSALRLRNEFNNNSEMRMPLLRLMRRTVSS